MDLDSLFEAYYTIYRTEADTPNSEDDEYIIFTRLANEAINRWANYDGTFWAELHQSAQVNGDGDLTVDLSNTEGYAAPDDMRKKGGLVKILNSDGVVQDYIPIIEPHEKQFRSQFSNFAHFTGDPNNGYLLHINNQSDNWEGFDIDYDYYMKPTLLENGSDVPQMSQPYFIVHRALANRLRGSRNPYYGSAKDDAEDVLKTMKMENDSGGWGNPWKLPDNSGGTFGV